MTAEPAESEESAPAAALRSRALGDGERRGLPSHHRGAPGPRQRRPERPRRRLHPEPALGVPATQNLGAGESAAGAGERRRRAAPCLRRRRPFPHPQFLPSPPGEGPFPAGEARAPLLPGPSSRPAAGCWDHPACSAGAGSAPEGQARGVPSSLLLCGDLWLFSLLLPCIICQSVRVWTTKCFSIILWFFRFLGANPTGQLNLLDSVFRYYARRRERCTISCLKF